MASVVLTRMQQKTLLHAQQGELDAVVMYKALAAAVRDPDDAVIFRTLAAEEGGHAAVFRALTHKSLKPRRAKAVLLPLLYRLFGKKRIYPLIASGEYDAAKKYEPIISQFPQAESIKNDEQRHGDTVLSLLQQVKAD